MPIKVISKWQEGIEGAESPLNKVRRRIVHFLGTLGGQINTSLVESESAAAYAAKAVAWDSKNWLEFALPFQDMKPTLYLGKSINMAYMCILLCDILQVENLNISHFHLLSLFYILVIRSSGQFLVYR